MHNKSFLVLLALALITTNAGSDRQIQIINASNITEPIILDILENIDIEVLNHINSISIVSIETLNQLCEKENKTVYGCNIGIYSNNRFIQSDIVILDANASLYYLKGFYIFRYVVAHEIGHTQGILSEDKSEDFADNFALGVI